MSEKHAQKYQEGYQEGKSAGWMDQISHNMECFVPGTDSPYEKSFDAGYKDGLEDKGDEKNSHYSGGSTDSSDDHDPCFITTACVRSKGLPDDCDELETMREFRNKFVLRLENGKELHEEYKRIAPIIIDSINHQNESKLIYDAIYNEIVKMVNLIKNGKNLLALEKYKDMVVQLNDV